MSGKSIWCSVPTPAPKQGCCLETLDSCIRWPHHCWEKFWTLQRHIQEQHCGRGWHGLWGWSNHPELPRQGCLHYQSHQTCHLDSRHERNRNSRKDFVVWVLLSPKCLNLVRLIQSVMRFGGSQNFQKTNVSVLSVPRTFSTVPTTPNTRTRTRTLVGDLDWGQVGVWMRRVGSLAFYWHSKKVSGPPLCPSRLTKRRTYRPRSVIYRYVSRQNSEGLNHFWSELCVRETSLSFIKITQSLIY